MFFYADRRAARKTEAHLRAAELEHLRKSKLALESRLQAMQARVEPQFLFNTLSQIERLYELEDAKAQRMLDDLIDYLRAAMPLMRGTSSTVDQEMRLVGAYIDIVRLRFDERLVFEIDVPEGIEDARLPPMMLLPLIDRAVGAATGARRSQERGRIATEASNERLRISIGSTNAAFAPEATRDDIEGIRERLAGLFGTDASLVLRRCDEERSEAVLDIPRESAAMPATP